jgi:electron transfer flavoprotein-quinone oxidoreductase
LDDRTKVRHVHDCIVVGAGPAGSAAALQMARDGLDVVLLERGTRPGEKNVMSGVLLTQALHALVPDFAERAPLQRRITGGYEAYLLSHDEVLRLPSLRSYRCDRFRHPPYTVFRSEFDDWFAGEAEAAGAELFNGTLVEDLLWDKGCVAGVRTRRGDLRARVVLGADGVNSTVAEKAGLLAPLSDSELSLIVREVLNLPAEQIEERFNLRSGEGVLSLYYGLVAGAKGQKGMYYTELYTNSDSISLTVEVFLDVMQSCGVPAYEVLSARERHPYIAGLIQGATLREYQAHLIPWGGVGGLDVLYDRGVLLAGDAGKFTTRDGVGSWTSMASGIAAARTVKHACEKGDSSRATLAVYERFLDEEGLVDTQRQAREEWSGRGAFRDILDRYPDQILHLAERYADEWVAGKGEDPYSLLGEAYYEIVKPELPWYVRWPLDLAAWVDTRRWRRRNDRKGLRHGN